jgi:serine/threonine-protein kinase
MHPQHARDPELLAMFLDEARLVARLRHPNVVEVYDIGEDGGEYFFTMEYIDGEDLRELLRRHAGAPLPLAHALTIARDVAAGLDHAHDLTDADGRPFGIVHRDVSPSNVLVGIDGSVKLTDFGVAKWAAQRTETRHGMLKGKVAYMAPEQARGGEVDRRTDVFALGVLVYELTTGARPFEAATDYELLAAIAAGEPIAPTVRRNDYPAALEAIVQRALARDPERRWPTARAFAEALRAFAAEAGLTGTREELAAYVRGLVGDRADPRMTPVRAPVSSERGVVAQAGARTLTEAAPVPTPVTRPTRVARTRALVTIAVAAVALTLVAAALRDRRAPTDRASSPPAPDTVVTAPVPAAVAAPTPPPSPAQPPPRAPPTNVACNCSATAPSMLPPLRSPRVTRATRSARRCSRRRRRRVSPGAATSPCRSMNASWRRIRLGSRSTPRASRSPAAPSNRTARRRLRQDRPTIGRPRP